MYGTPELQLLLQSPLGSLFSLPVRQCSLSGQLLHQLLCRQLFTEEIDATWFVFAGQPLRFSLKEFEEITGLCCSEYPSAAEVRSATSYADGESPYWYKLIGGQLGSTTVKSLVARLKSDSDMPSWRKFQIALVVIVEGVLLSASQPVRPSFEVVEMVKNVEFFLQYPWGRHSFSRTLRLMKVGSHIRSKDCLIKKLNQSSLALHGFPLALQLFAFRYIPLLRTHLPHSDDESTFRDQTVQTLPKLKSFHTSTILSVEYDADVSPLLPLTHSVTAFNATNFVYYLQVIVHSPSVSDSFLLPTACADPKVSRLEALFRTSSTFALCSWEGGDATFPPLPRPKKRRLTARSGERGKKKRKTRRQSKQSTAGLFRISKSSIIDDVCRVHQSSTHDAASSSTSTSIDEKHISLPQVTQTLVQPSLVHASHLHLPIYLSTFSFQGHLSQPPTPALSEASVGGTSAVPPLANPVNRDASVTKSEPFILSAEADDTCVTSALV